MTRKNFIKNLITLGAATPLMTSLFTSCNRSGFDFFEDFEVNFNGNVLIIGAGAAGLIAGHILNRYNIDFQILEASSVFGGRVKKIEDFSDFPIDLGAEWIHTEPSILGKLLNDPQTDLKTDAIVYNPQTIHLWKNNKLKKRNIFSSFYSEHKFKNSTWYDFFDQYIVPGISDKIVYNSPVTEIDYNSNKVKVQSQDGEIREADKVILTVPLTILQNNFINFLPALPSEKTEALNQVSMPDGIKVFIEFSERFYPDILLFGNIIEALRDESKIFYDAAFQKDSDRNILGLFNVGDSAAAYTSLNTEQEIIDKIIGELDEIFDGKASQTYQKHIIQNWSKEPFISGSYSHYDDYDALETLAQSINDKIYFAGEAYSSDSQATVHGAGETAYKVTEQILKG